MNRSLARRTLGIQWCSLSLFTFTLSLLLSVDTRIVWCNYDSNGTGRVLSSISLSHPQSTDLLTWAGSADLCAKSVSIYTKSDSFIGERSSETIDAIRPSGQLISEHVRQRRSRGWDRICSLDLDASEVWAMEWHIVWWSVHCCRSHSLSLTDNRSMIWTEFRPIRSPEAGGRLRIGLDLSSLLINARMGTRNDSLLFLFACCSAD